MRKPRARRGAVLMVLLPLALAVGRLEAQESPYFSTYNHHLEDPGELEISVNPVFGTQRGGNSFLAWWTEFEYGVTRRWTTEFYLDGNKTFHESTVFTGWRWENRVRVLKEEHRINPVFYAEFEHTNGASKVLQTIVGHDIEEDDAVPVSVSREEHQRELEFKMILSSNVGGWNVSENFTAEKELLGGPWEFGYAWGVSRPLALATTTQKCGWCRENVTAGFEMYGGLGDRHDFGLHETSHYVAPVLAWKMPRLGTWRISPTFGLNDNSHRFLLRWSVMGEIGGFGHAVGRVFGH